MAVSSLLYLARTVGSKTAARGIWRSLVSLAELPRFSFAPSKNEKESSKCKQSIGIRRVKTNIYDCTTAVAGASSLKTI